MSASFEIGDHVTVEHRPGVFVVVGLGHNPQPYAQVRPLHTSLHVPTSALTKVEDLP